MISTTRARERQVNENKIDMTHAFIHLCHSSHFICHEDNGHTRAGLTYRSITQIANSTGQVYCLAACGGNIPYSWFIKSWLCPVSLLKKVIKTTRFKWWTCITWLDTVRQSNDECVDQWDQLFTRHHGDARSLYMDTVPEAPVSMYNWRRHTSEASQFVSSFYYFFFFPLPPLLPLFFSSPLLCPSSLCEQSRLYIRLSEPVLLRGSVHLRIPHSVCLCVWANC